MVVLESDFYGHARIVDPVAAATVVQLWARRNRVTTLVTTGAGASCRLPDARKLRWPGFPAFFVFNDGTSTHSFSLANFDGTALRTIAVGEMAMVSLEDQSSAAGLWGVSSARTFTAGGAF